MSNDKRLERGFVLRRIRMVHTPKGPMLEKRFLQPGGAHLPRHIRWVTVDQAKIFIRLAEAEGAKSLLYRYGYEEHELEVLHTDTLQPAPPPWPDVPD